MAFIFPFVADKFTAYADDKEKTTTKLSLAVRVIDGVNDQVITNGIKVSLVGDKIYQPIQNLSGYYCFSDMPRGKYKISVKGDQFFNEEKLLDIPLIIDESNRYKEIVVEEFALTPKPSYLFSANATLIRGMVSRKPVSPANNGEPVVNAQMLTVYQGEQDKMETQTDHNGEFVLLIKKIKLKEKDGGTKKIIEDIISIDIKDKNGKSISKTTTFLEGQTSILMIDDFPAI